MKLSVFASLVEFRFQSVLELTTEKEPLPNWSCDSNQSKHVRDRACPSARSADVTGAFCFKKARNQQLTSDALSSHAEAQCYGRQANEHT